MKRAILIIAAIIVLAIAAFIALNSYIYNEKQGDTSAHYKEITFTISGVRTALLDKGKARVRTSLTDGSMSTLRYHGDDLVQDIDGDGVEDIVFLITQTTDTRMFFYAVGALKRDTGYVGTQAVFLGDANKVSPETTEKGEGRTVIVNYVDPGPAGRTEAGPIMKRIHLLLDPETLEFGEVVQEFEGESDTSAG